jgi:hypothetical protein
MPNYDGTGPFGDGRPGRGLGPCGRFGRPGRGGYGRGFGRGYGRGFGFRHRYGWDNYNSYRAWDDPEMYTYSRESLREQKQRLEEQLEWINSQIGKNKDN